MVERGQAAITCGQVDSFLAPCLAYLTGEAKPSRACCTGVEYLKDNTPTTADRQAACKCIKDAATRYRGIKLDKARQLPKECGVDIGVPITPDIDCSKWALICFSPLHFRIHYFTLYIIDIFNLHSYQKKNQFGFVLAEFLRTPTEALSLCVE